MSNIVVENVFFNYAKTKVLEDVTFSIKDKEFVGFIGPNGGGKTTLLKLLMGLLKLQKGKIEIFGKKPQYIRHKIGYVPQVAKVDRDFPITVLELVLLGCLSQANFFGAYTKEKKEEAIHLLEQLGLLHLRNKPFSTLSGGETQRALIAKALICDPDILVLDEPTANIDVAAERKIFEMLLKYKGKKTVLIVSHALEVIIEHVDKVFLVQKTVQTKSVKDICKHFALGLYHTPKNSEDRKL